MPATLTIRDQTSTGETINELTLNVHTERITVRELIRSRVFQEVKDYNASQPDVFRGLVQPTDAERTPDGYKLEARRKIDWEPQYEKAIDAFEAHQILILLDNRQADALDEEIVIAPETTVSFVRLMPLVGG